MTDVCEPTDKIAAPNEEMLLEIIKCLRDLLSKIDKVSTLIVKFKMRQQIQPNHVLK